MRFTLPSRQRNLLLHTPGVGSCAFCVKTHSQPSHGGSACKGLKVFSMPKQATRRRVEHLCVGWCRVQYRGIFCRKDIIYNKQQQPAVVVPVTAICDPGGTGPDTLARSRGGGGAAGWGWLGNGVTLVVLSARI